MDSEHQPGDDFNVYMDDPVSRRDVRLSANSAFNDLAIEFNTSVQEQDYVLTDEYSSITKRAQDDLKQLLKDRCMLAARSIAPTHYEELFNDMIRTEFKKLTGELTQNDIWIVQLKALLPKLNKSEKIVAISVFAFTETKRSLALKLDIPERIIRAARKHSKNVAAGVREQRAKIVRHKIKPAQVEHFMDFLFDTQLQTMSWGK